MTNTDEANWRPRGDPDPIDIYVGGRARLRRVLMGMSQEAVAAHLGISFQQLQKYESGNNRISASRLYDLAHALQVGVAYFFEDMSADLTASSDGQCVRAETLDSRITIDLVREFQRIQSAQQRHSLLELIRSMAKNPISESGESAQPA